MVSPKPVSHQGRVAHTGAAPSKPNKSGNMTTVNRCSEFSH